MKETISAIVGLLMILAVVLGLGWIIQGNDFFLYKVFAPKYEDARRNTFEHSKAYQQGMVQELDAMRFEYVKATPEQQKALRSIILHRAADYQGEMPTELAGFIAGLRNEKENVKW